jgi:hypothetical protein
MEAILGLVGALLLSLGINILQAKRVGKVKQQLAQALTDRSKEVRKDALDAEPLPADADDFWVRDEPE